MRQLLTFFVLAASLSSSFGQSPITPNVVNGLSVSLPDSGILHIRARDLVLRPDQNGCIWYAFSDNPSDSLRVFDCTNLGTNIVSVWAGSSISAGSTRSETYIIIQDGANVCGGNPIPGTPAVWCRSGIAVSLPAIANIMLWTSDIDFGTYRFNDDTGLVMSFSASPQDQMKTLYCNDVGTKVMDLWATGANGAQNHCSAYVVLQDNLDFCSGPASFNAIPSAFAWNGLSITADLAGNIRLRAKDLNCGSFSNINYDTCQLSFSFSNNPADSIRTFDPVNELGIQVVELWVHDQCGYANFVQTYVLVSADAELPCSGIPCNDQRSEAISLSMDATCFGVYSNQNAGVESGEPEPNTGLCGDPHTWCDAQGAEHTVWFRFEAPTSGSVRIESAGMNTQIAVWQDVAGVFTLVDAADDPAPGVNAAELQLLCLDPGSDYYIQVDGFEGEQGQFFLKCYDAGIACLVTGGGQGAVACGQISVNPVVSNGAGVWQHFMDSEGKVLASINDNGQTLGTVQANFMVHEGPTRTAPNDVPYANRNWVVTPEIQPTQPVQVRLYAETAVWNDLVAEPGGPIDPNEANATKVSGESCGDYTGGGVLLNQIGHFVINDSGDLAFDFSVTDFSAFYIHGLAKLSPTTYLSEKGLSIAPNPVQDFIIINGLGNLPTTTRLMSVQGVLFQEWQTQQETLRLELPGLSSGIYTLTIIQGDQVRTIKLTAP